MVRILEMRCGSEGSGKRVLLTGIAASGGWAIGRARVLTTPGEIQLAGGEILVLPDLRAVWWPLFCAAGGVIVVQGAILAAGATVAREYGLPMVVALAGAMRHIATGQLITVDGGRGVVYVSDKHDPDNMDGAECDHYSTLALRTFRSSLRSGLDPARAKSGAARC